jgi:hypothetical protein
MAQLWSRERACFLNLSAFSMIHRAGYNKRYFKRNYIAKKTSGVLLIIEDT